MLFCTSGICWDWRLGYVSEAEQFYCSKISNIIMLSKSEILIMQQAFPENRKNCGWSATF